MSVLVLKKRDKEEGEEEEVFDRIIPAANTRSPWPIEETTSLSTVTEADRTRCTMAKAVLDRDDITERA